MRRVLATAIAAAAVVAALAHSAAAQSQVTGYDGKNPFECTLQQLGGGTNFPEPNADPFCVEYDKRHQNIDQLGVVEFLSHEPARFAAASNKCFYFQHDHWRGSVSESQPQTQTYNWDGSYFFDKARGIGGAYVENFSFAGQTGDPTQLPGFPPDYKPYFSKGRGGVQKSGEVQADPNCVKKFKEHDPRAGGGPGGAGTAGADHCRVPGGRVNHGIGGIRLGWKRARVRNTMGPPTVESARFVSYCMSGGGRLAAAFDRSGPGGKVLLVVTDSPPFDARGVRTGSSIRKARETFPDHDTVSWHGLRALQADHPSDVILLGLGSKRVTFVAVTGSKVAAHRAIDLIRAAPH